MRSFVFIFILLIPNLVCAKTNLIVKGYAPLLSNGTEISLRLEAPKRFSDLYQAVITQVKDHKFEFLINSKEVDMYYLSGNGGGSLIYIQPGVSNVIITDSILRKVIVSGGLATIEYNEYVTITNDNPFFREYGIARVDYSLFNRSDRRTDSALLKKKKEKTEHLLLLSNNKEAYICLKWIRAHRNSQINTNILYHQLGHMSESDIKKAFRLIHPSARNNRWGKELKYCIDSTFLGGTAPNFSLPDKDGNQQRLSNFKGKYILVDFWASWCNPCRRESPYLKEVFRQWGAGDFLIVSISVDENHSNWDKAIVQDGTQSFIHLIDDKGWKSPITAQYNIEMIPSNFLIDPAGKIIDKDLRGEKLITRITEITRNVKK